MAAAERWIEAIVQHSSYHRDTCGVATHAVRDCPDIEPLLDSTAAVASFLRELIAARTTGSGLLLRTAARAEQALAMLEGEP